MNLVERLLHWPRLRSQRGLKAGSVSAWHVHAYHMRCSKQSYDLVPGLVPSSAMGALFGRADKKFPTVFEGATIWVMAVE